MVASVNGMMVDHSASSQVPEPVPMPEAQRDLIAEAMKVQMKQGQVLYTNLPVPTSSILVQSVTMPATGTVVHVSLMFECLGGDKQRDEHTLWGIGGIVHSRAPAECLVQLLVNIRRHERSVIPYSGTLYRRRLMDGVLLLRSPIQYLAGQREESPIALALRLPAYNVCTPPLYYGSSSTRGTLYHCGPDAFQKSNLSGDSFRVAWACET